jgi:ABC-type spermidine/putrescine transport system permease subunit I
MLRHTIADFLEKCADHKFLFLLAPPLVFIGAFFIIPIFWMIRISFYPGGSFEYEPGFTLDHYLRFFLDPYYLGTAFYTLKITLCVTPFVLVFSYAVSYLIATSSGKKGALYLMLIVTPLFTTEVVRALGFKIFLAKHGIINTLLLATGLFDEPLQLIYNDFAIVVALIHSIIPYACLVLIGVLVGIDKSYLEAAKTMGAGRIKTFWHVTLPLSIPGISGALVVSIIWCLSIYSIPEFLGSGAKYTMTMLIEEQILSVFNWPFADAVAAILVFLTAVGLAVSFKFSEKKEYK